MGYEPVMDAGFAADLNGSSQPQTAGSIGMGLIPTPGCSSRVDGAERQ